MAQIVMSVSDHDKKAAAQAKRQEIRNYIVNERDTIVRKWACLTESIHSEDKKREQFYTKKALKDTRILPDTIDKFLRTLKKSLGKQLRDKGGTPYSIVRNMFIYWDASKSGELNSEDLHRCLEALGVFITREQTIEIVQFYATYEGSSRMGYNSLLKDLLIGEPTLVQRAPTERETDEDRAKRFKMLEDKYIKKPRIVEKFLEAVRGTQLFTNLYFSAFIFYSNITFFFYLIIPKRFGHEKASDGRWHPLFSCQTCFLNV